MDFGLLRRNYMWPAVYAIGAAVSTEAVTQLTNGGGVLDGARLLAAGIAAASAFIGSRLNPYAGKDIPVVQPHV